MAHNLAYEGIDLPKEENFRYYREGIENKRDQNMSNSVHAPNFKVTADYSLTAKEIESKVISGLLGSIVSNYSEIQPRFTRNAR